MKNKSRKIKNPEEACRLLEMEVKLLREAYFQLKQTLKENEKIQKKLQESEQRLQNLLEHAPIGIFYTDAKGIFLYGNKAAEKITGYKKEELEGTTLQEQKFIDKKFLPRAKEIVKANKLGKSTGPDRFVFKTKNKQKRIVLLFTSVVRSAEGNLFLKILQDVTELERTREELEESETRYKTTIDQTGQIIYDYNIKTGKIKWNGAIEELTGYPPDEFKKFGIKEWEKNIHAEDKKTTIEILNKSIKRALPYQHEYRFRRKNGTYVDIQDRGAYVKDQHDGSQRLLGVMLDISHLKEIDRMKTEFLSLASHQLRTPLTAIRWNIELLESMMGKPGFDMRPYMSDVRDSTLRMVSLVNNLLNISRIETGRLKVESKEIEIEKFIKSLISELKPIAGARNVKIQYQPGKTNHKIKIDQNLFRQVIGNVVENAIKYSNSGDSIKIVVKKQEKRYIISIRDTGVGIPAYDQSNIFTKFFRASNASERDTQGSGLGLYISKLILKKTGGDIRFESKEGRGTIFYVSLPASGMQSVKGSKGLIS